MYDKEERRRTGNLAAVVSVRFDPQEVELLRQAAPRGKVSRFVREAAMREVRRMMGPTAGGSGRPDPGATALTDLTATSAPSTGAFSIAGTAGDRRTGSPAPWVAGPDNGEAGPAPLSADR